VCLYVIIAGLIGAGVVWYQFYSSSASSGSLEVNAADVKVDKVEKAVIELKTIKVQVKACMFWRCNPGDKTSCIFINVKLSLIYSLILCIKQNLKSINWNA